MITINVDRNVGLAGYQEIAERGNLLVTSSFYTFQGEGPYAGHPAWFLRLAGCNLGAKRECPWCDTRFNFDEGKELTFQQLWAAYKTEAEGRSELIVVTGGEPLLQWEAMREFIAWSNRGQESGRQWQFETNGVLLDEVILSQAQQLGNVMFVVSPKVIGGRYRDIPEVWREYMMIALKYVVSADPASEYHLPPRVEMFTVYLSGQTEYGPGDEPTKPGSPFSMRTMSAQGRAATLRNWEYAAKRALALGYRVSFQTHLLAGVE